MCCLKSLRRKQSLNLGKLRPRRLLRLLRLHRDRGLWRLDDICRTCTNAADLCLVTQPATDLAWATPARHVSGAPFKGVQVHERATVTYTGWRHVNIGFDGVAANSLVCD
jgi:hypothetical protein